MSEKLWYLKNCGLFERLSAEELGRLESRSRARTFPRKSLVYLPHDEADSIGLLTSGRVKITHVTGEGKQAILTFIEPGEIFGELAVFEESGQRDDYAEAMEKSTVVLIPADEIRSLMETHAQLSLGVTKLIGLRRKRIERRLKHLLFRSNRERLVHLLLELAEQYGKASGDEIHLGIKLSHQDLASVIGSTRESVTVVLGELQYEQLIKVHRRRIILLQPSRLAASVEEEPPKLPADAPAANPAVQYR